MVRWACVGSLGLLWILAPLHAQPGRPVIPESAPVLHEVLVKPGIPIRAELAGVAQTVYVVPLYAGQVLDAVVEQKGVDVSVHLLSPTGQELLLVDTPNATEGSEPVFWVAEVSGMYRLQVRGQSTHRLLGWSKWTGTYELRASSGATTVEQGSYEVSVQPARPATESDRARARGERWLSEAESLQRQGGESQQVRVEAAYKEAVKEFLLARALVREQVAWGLLSQRYTAHQEQIPPRIAALERVLAIARELKSRYGEGLTLNSIGIAYSGLNQWELAIRYFKQALPMTELHNTMFAFLAPMRLGDAYASLSQWEQAIKYYEQALAVARNPPVVHDGIFATRRRIVRNQALALMTLGLMYRTLGQHERAIRYYEQSLVAARQSQQPDVENNVLTALGFSYASLGQHQRAFNCYEQALAIARATKSPYDESGTLTAFGDLHERLGQHERAAAYYEQALATAKELHRYPSARDEIASNALNGLGSAYVALGQYETATSSLEQALVTVRESKNRATESEILHNLMQAWSKRKQPRLAVFYGKQAVNTLQGIRSEMRGLDQDLQRSYLQGHARTYRQLADLLLRQGRLLEAQQVLSLLKEEEFFDFVRRDPTTVIGLRGRADLTPEEVEWAKRYQEVSGHLVASGTRRDQLLAKPSLTAEDEQQLSQIEQDLIIGNHAFQRFLTELGAHFRAKPDVGGDKLEKLSDAESLKADLTELRHGAVALYTLVGEDRYHVILVTSEVQKAYSYSIPAAELNRKILAFRQVLDTPRRDPRPLAQELYQILIGPELARDLRQAGAETLMWSLDSTLRYVPMAALYDGRQYLVERYRLSVFTPASHARLKDAPKPTWRAVGFGVSQAHPGFSPLPSVADELRAIVRDPHQAGRGVLDGQVLLDEYFTSESMQRALRQAQPVVHIASHFRFQPGDATHSFLLLGDGGHLTLAQMQVLPDLFRGVDLLTLSACNTGLGDAGVGADGREIEGFGMLAQKKGAKAVLASLWPVADNSTSQLMREFYRLRQSRPGVLKAEALRQAQLAMLHGGVRSATADPSDQRASVTPAESGTTAPAVPLSSELGPRFHPPAEAPYAHPYYWAPFFLIGNWQ